MEQNKKKVAIIQARMGSTRLPGKVMMDLCGMPVLQHVVERTRRCSALDTVVIATSLHSSDDCLETFAKAYGVPCFRGDLEDVLNRFYAAALWSGAGHVVRITADCPLIDPEVMRKVIAMYDGGGFDYVSNVYPPTYPDGLDVEVFSMAALATAWREAVRGTDRRHVTAFISENEDRTRFRCGNVRNDHDFSACRWTVDNAADMELVRAIVGHFGHNRFLMDDVVAFLDQNPQLVALNRESVRDASYLKELEAQRQEQAKPHPQAAAEWDSRTDKA